MRSKIIAALAIAASFGSGAFAQEKIKIGSIYADSGPFAPMIRYVQEPSALAIELLNAKGGALGRKYELIQMAHNGTPAAATAAVTRLTQESGVHFITGFSSSASSQAIIPKLFGLNALMLETTANSAELIGKSCNSNYFHLVNTDGMMIEALRPVVTQSGAKTWNLLLPDYALGHHFNKEFRKFLDEAGATVQTTLFVPLSTSDFGSQISQLRDKPADGLLVVFPVASGAVALAKQAKQFGLFERYKTVVSSQFANPLVIDAQGDAVAGFYSPLSYWWEMPGTRNAEFVKAFERRFNRKPTFFDAETFQAFELLNAAIQKAGTTDVAAVRAALSSIKVETILGNVAMRPADQQLLRPMVLTRVVGLDGGKAEFKLQAILPAASVIAPASPECRL